MPGGRSSRGDCLGTVPYTHDTSLPPSRVCAVTPTSPPRASRSWGVGVLGKDRKSFSLVRVNFFPPSSETFGQCPHPTQLPGCPNFLMCPLHMGVDEPGVLWGWLHAGVGPGASWELCRLLEQGLLVTRALHPLTPPLPESRPVSRSSELES